MADSESESGISVGSGYGSASSPFMSGAQIESILGGQRGVTEAARAAAQAMGVRADVAARQPELIREAGRRANALQLAQVARAVASAGQGQASGGGRARSSGTMALDQMRQAAAQMMSAEQAAGQAAIAAQGARVDASREGVTAAEAAREEAREAAALQAQQQQNMRQFTDDTQLMLANMKAAGASDIELGTAMMNRFRGLDLSSPAQREAAINALLMFAADQGVGNARAEDAARIIDKHGSSFFAKLAMGQRKADVGEFAGGKNWVQNIWNNEIPAPE